MKCLYCSGTDDEMFVIWKATKPPYHAFRWTRLGFCCISCHDEGRPVDIEYTPQVTVTHAQQVQPKEG